MIKRNSIIIIANGVNIGGRTKRVAYLPIQGPFGSSTVNGPYNEEKAFIACFGLNDALVWSTLWGNPGSSEYRIADMNGNSEVLYVTGTSGKGDHADFQINNTGNANAYQQFNNLGINTSSNDAFITKFNTKLKKVIWSSYIGGEFDDSGLSIDFEDDTSVTGTTGKVYLTGKTQSHDAVAFPLFPADTSMFPNAFYDSVFVANGNGNYEGFIAAFSDMKIANQYLLQEQIWHPSWLLWGLGFISFIIMLFWSIILFENCCCRCYQY